MIPRSQLLDRLGAELTRVVGALRETSASSRPVTPSSEDGFVVTIEASQGQRGHLTVFFERPGAEAAAQALAQATATPSDAQVVDAVRDLTAQAVAGLTRQELGCAFTVVNAQTGPAPDPLPSGLAPVALEVVVSGEAQSLVVVLNGHIEPAPQTAGAPGHGRTLDVLMDIELPLVVRFGRTALPLKTLTEMGPGSVIDLGRSPDDPVEILISNRVVARGEVVIVAGHYGVRVRDVVSPAERARSLEAEPV